MRSITTLFLSSFATLTSAVSLCDQYSTYNSNGYIFNNDEWNENAGSGSGCIYIDDDYNTGVIFHVAWSWSGGENGVKAYPNVGLDVTTGQLISGISSMPTESYWSYEGSDIRADVSYDLFSAADPNHDPSYGDYELMIWLASLGGVDPLGSPGETVTLSGYSWTVWYGTNSGNGQQTYSFIPSDGNYIEAFTNADIMDFWNYLAQNKGYPASSQYLLTSQFGTEPFTGSGALLNVTWHTVSIN